MNFALSQAVNHSADVGGVSILCEVGAPMHHTFLCLEMTDSPKILVLRLPTVSRFRRPFSLQPTGYFPVTFRVDHLVLEVQPVGLAEDHSSGGIWVPASLLGTVAPAMKCVTS